MIDSFKSSCIDPCDTRDFPRPTKSVRGPPNFRKTKRGATIQASENVHRHSVRPQEHRQSLCKRLIPLTRLPPYHVFCNAQNEFSRRVEQSSPNIAPTMAIFVRRATLRFVNQSSIPTLLKKLESDTADLRAHHARTLLAFTSKHCPSLYKPHVGELIKGIAAEDNGRLVEVCLQAFSSLVKWDPKVATWDK